ncbi:MULTISPECIES: DUF4870 domain-containing protein [Microbulbifer]|uniref:DUF4870 domain-containing protein n=2 Tax=Microbulbiferaceae TaxID=1706373 RepID=UPI001E37BA1C|nr:MULTISPECIES: DUF4870 domain-containing protein [Microbulbifer]UHQ53695.1 DUF4870 domain-containing protein [Microbulbifer sp. YPW16]
MNEIRPWGMDKNTFLMLMHLSQLTGFFLPVAGFALPIIMWATNKDQSVEIDRHGKVILNWMISLIIYALICSILVFVVIGILGFFVLLLVEVIFVVIAAVKASEGELWQYPLSIKFFQVPGA